jgi:hypothetical protein
MNPLKTKTNLNFIFNIPITTAQCTPSVSLKQFNYLMLHRGIIVVCYEILTNQNNKLCGQNPELFLKYTVHHVSRHIYLTNSLGTHL